MDAQLVERIKREIEFESTRSAPPAGFPDLPDIPAGRYIDPAFFELEQKHIWSKTWLLVGHTDEVPEPGCFRLCDEIGVPILVVRGKDRVVRGFYNTCRHRGGPVVREKTGHANPLRCMYHSWTYDLEGNLIGVPDERDFTNLDKSCRALIPVRCETWGGWIFVNQDLGAMPLLDYLAPVPTELDEFEVEKLRFVERHSMDLACNWKVAIDAFLEVYHLKHIHPNTVNRLLDHAGTTMGLLPRGHSRMASPIRPESRASYGGGKPDVPEIESAGEIPRITNLAYHIFPNLVTPLDVVGFPFLMFWPRDIRTTHFEVLWFGPDWGQPEMDERWKAYISIFDVVLGEDTENLPWIQKSVESPGFRSIPLSYQERRIYAFHEQIDRTLGAQNIPDELRIAPRLEKWVE